MIELPVDFPHSAPEGYSYEVEEFKRGVQSIWLVHHKKYVYAEDKTVRTIWGFYKPKSRQYFAPINAKTVGDKVDINGTRNYTSMPLNLNPLEAAFL